MALRYLLVLIILAIIVGFSVELEDQNISSDGGGQLQTLCKAIINDTVTPDNLNTTSGNVSTCEDDCRRKYTPADGTVNSLYSELYGWVLNISCNQDYELKGRASIICYEDIETKDFPVCEKQDALPYSLILISVGCGLLVCVCICIFTVMRWRKRHIFKRVRINPSLEIEQYHYKNMGIKLRDQKCIQIKADTCSSLIKMYNVFDERVCQNDIATPTVEDVLYITHEVNIEIEQEHEINSNSVQTNDSVRRDAVCKEVAVYPNRVQAPAICLVKPLQAGDEHTIAAVENDNEIHEIVSGQVEPSQPGGNTAVLNWNKLFMYLVPRVCTDDWKLFAINLLSETLPQGQSVNTVISQIVMDSKTQHGGERIEVILYNILWNWYKRSKSASLTVIEKALQWSHNEDIIRDMNNHIKEFYICKGKNDGCTSPMNNGLNGIPELEYRVRPQKQAIALFPCIEGEVYTKELDPVTQGSGRVVLYSEELVTCDDRFAETETKGFRYKRGKHWYTLRTKRQYSYPPFPRLRYQNKTHTRIKFPARSKPKVQFRKKRMEMQSTAGPHVSDKDTRSVNYILDFDPQTKIDHIEYRMILKNVLYEVQVSSKTSMGDLMGITYAEYKTCEHVLTSRNGTLHIINGVDARIILMDDIWTLVDTYVRRERCDILCRIPDTNEQYLFLTFEGEQVTRDYFQVNDTDTTEPIDVMERTENKTDPNSGEQLVTMDTNNEEKPIIKSGCKTDEALGFKRRLPRSRNSNRIQCTKQVALDTTKQNGQHGRRYFCDNQARTIEKVFSKEIKQGSVKETTILSTFHNSSELQEVFGVQPEEVTKILIKKVADRVRCFIRKQKNQSKMNIKN